MRVRMYEGSYVLMYGEPKAHTYGEPKAPSLGFPICMGLGFPIRFQGPSEDYKMGLGTQGPSCL